MISTMEKIKVLLVDDHPTVRMGISKLIENQEDIEVCGETGSINKAMTLIEKTKPDVILVDIAFDNNINGIDLVKTVKERSPKIITIIHSMYEESVYAERAIRAGARGYIQKNAKPSMIISAIRNAVKGELILSSKLKDSIINKILQGNKETTETDIDILTNREFEIFQLFGKGLSIKEIAERIHLSQHTVETHRRNIKEKLKITSNSQLIKLAVEWSSSRKLPIKST